VGAAIALGVIALPIMMSMGIPPWVAAPAFTMAIGAGNYANLVVFNIFKPIKLTNVSNGGRSLSKSGIGL
jgi:hypothetical protein